MKLKLNIIIYKRQLSEWKYFYKVQKTDLIKFCNSYLKRFSMCWIFNKI